MDDYKAAWEALRASLAGGCEQTDFAHNSTFNPMTMALHAERQDWMLRMDELEQEHALAPTREWEHDR